jgi:DNA-binding response OmpR family regulator
VKILLLEDEAMLNEAIGDYLRRNGHIVNSYDDGKKALEALLSDSFDLLVLDINVPNIDGLKLLETLHSHKIQTPTIYISALVDIEDISRAYDLGCYDYLKKPFHLKELLIRIERVMQLRKTPELHIRVSKNYSYSQQNSTLYFENIPCSLSKRQLDIIDLLAKNRSIVVDFDMFREYIWSENFVDNATIRAEVNRLKKSLKEDFILNIRSLGYMIETPK